MLLHLLALVPAVVGLCCLAADRRRARALEVGAAALMTLAMADAAVTGLVPAVAWAAALLVAAMALGATAGRARAASREDEPRGGAMRGGAMRGGLTPGGAMAVHAAAGLVAMAALMLVTAGAPGVPPAVATGAHHRASVSALAGAAGVAGAAYLGASVVLVVRGRGALARVQYVAMAGSVALMSLALVA